MGQPNWPETPFEIDIEAVQNGVKIDVPLVMLQSDAVSISLAGGFADYRQPSTGALDGTIDIPALGRCLPLTLASLALLKLKGLSIFQLISLFRLIQTLRRNGRFSFNNNQNKNFSNLSFSESCKILNLDENKRLTKEDINKAYLKIQKKIHPDISPETSRLSSIVNEARDVLLNEIK